MAEPTQSNDPANNDRGQARGDEHVDASKAADVARLVLADDGAPHLEADGHLLDWIVIQYIRNWRKELCERLEDRLNLWNGKCFDAERSDLNIPLQQIQARLLKIFSSISESHSPEGLIESAASPIEEFHRLQAELPMREQELRERYSEEISIALLERRIIGFGRPRGFQRLQRIHERSFHDQKSISGDFDQLRFLVWHELPSVIRDQGDEVERSQPIRSVGRPKGSHYEKVDRPFVERAEELYRTGNAQSRHAAARAVVSQDPSAVAGGGSEDTKIKRIRAQMRERQ